MSLTFFTSAFIKAPMSLLDKTAIGSQRLRVRWGVFVHPEHGPVLIDCGYGPALYRAPSVPLRAYTAALRPDLVTSAMPEVALKSLGYSMGDVRYIVLTHFHADHVCHLSSFPDAKVFVDLQEFSLFQTRSKFQNIASGVFGELIPEDIFKRYIPIQERQTERLPAEMGIGFDLFGDGTLITVPLPGHSPHHFGVLVDRPNDTPVLYAADTDWTMHSLMSGNPAGWFAKLVQADDAQTMASKTLVRNFARSVGSVVLCHDPELTDLDAQETYT